MRGGNRIFIPYRPAPRVALLGARITAAQIVSLGIVPIATVAISVVSTILIGSLLAKRLGLSRGFGILSGGCRGDMRGLGGVGDCVRVARA